MVRAPQLRRGILPLSADMIGDIADLVRQGAHPAIVAGRVGTSTSAVKDWLTRGRELAAAAEAGDLPTVSAHDCLCVRLWDAVDEARSHAAASLIKDVRKQAKKNFMAAKWLLEQLFPEELRPVREAEALPSEPEARVVIALPDNGRQP